MTWFRANARALAAELSESIERIDPAQIAAITDAIRSAGAVHLIGVGREGLATRAFAMRLMHLGVAAHWIWDDTTPSIGPGDLLIATSGSGQIGHIDYVARRALEHGARLCVVTADPRGRTAEAAEVTLVVPGAAYGAGDDVVASIQPMGSLFEQALLVTFDLIVLELMALGDKEFDDLSRRHRNVE